MTYTVVSNELAQKIGVEEAFVFSYIKGWVENCGYAKDGKKWIRHTIAQFVKELNTFSAYKVSKIINRLVELGLLEKAKLGNSKYDHGFSYTYNMDKFNELTNAKKIVKKQEKTSDNVNVLDIRESGIHYIDLVGVPSAIISNGESQELVMNIVSHRQNFLRVCKKYGVTPTN